MINEIIEYQNLFENDLHLIGKSKSFVEAYYDVFGFVESCLEYVMNSGQPISYQTIINSLGDCVSDITHVSDPLQYQLGKQNAFIYFESYLTPTTKQITIHNYSEIDHDFQEKYKYVMFVLDFLINNNIDLFEGFN